MLFNFFGLFSGVSVYYVFKLIFLRHNSFIFKNNSYAQVVK